MIKTTRLGEFELLEQIDPGGYTMVYKAVQHMGRGITRPAAVKVLQHFNVEDEAQMAQLQREVELLVELSSCPNIVTIYGFGVDEETGPWIAMELGGRSVKHFIGDEPAEPDQVRMLLRDTLRAMAIVHGADPPILHRDLKPNNILSTEFGTWKIADFGLAKRRGADETLNLVTVQYAAPELLDATLGEEGPQMDLYALGMVAYEFALGHRLYRKQFPSVYDPYADSQASADDRPKWMYWHTSMQMAVPPLAEVIDDYPRDLSELVASMTAKPLDDRVESSAKALTRLGHVDDAELPVEVPDDETLAPPQSRVPALVGVIVALVVVIAGGGLVWRQVNARPVVDLAPVYTASTPEITVTGTIENFPTEGSAEVTLLNGTSFPVVITDDEGGFHSQVSLNDLDAMFGSLSVIDRTGRVVAKKNLTVERIPPEKVEVTVRTRPAVSGARVLITDHARPESPATLKTNVQGMATIDVTYGSFDVAINHERFRPLPPRTFSTGIDPKREVPAPLTELSAQEIYAKTKASMDCVQRLAEKKATVGLTSEEEEELKRCTERLQQLAGDDPDVAEFLDAVKDVKEGDPSSLARLQQAAEKANQAIEDKERDRVTQNTLATAGGGNGNGGTVAVTEGVSDEVKRIVEAVSQGRNPLTGEGVDLGTVSAQTLMALPLGVLRDFLELNVPSGALVVEAVAPINKVRISGPLFNQAELERLGARLAAAGPRLQLELRVDPWAVCRHLESRLGDDGVIGPRVHAYLAPGDNAMYVQYTMDERFGRDDLLAVARRFVLDRDLLRIQGYREP